MFNKKEFIECRHSLLIAPAGYGKTYTIAECLKLVNGKHLVLTHTNAGIGSILEKVKSLNVPSENYQILTISSFAQMLVLPYTKELPAQEEKEEYFKVVIKRATALIKIKPIKRMIANSFSGLFVDEYQDCTLSQHLLIQELAELFPTHLLGDPMQGIFCLDKSEPIIDLDSKDKMKDFLEHKYTLDTPWRWNLQNKKELGNDLKRIRDRLMEEEVPIHDFSAYKNISSMSFPKIQLYGDYIEDGLKGVIYKLLKFNDNVLFIISNSTYRDARFEYVKIFAGKINMIESIDDKTFYFLSKMVDSFSNNGNNAIVDLYLLLIEFYPKTEIEKWVKPTRLTKKSEKTNGGKDFQNAKAFRDLVDLYVVNKELIYLYRILEIVPKIIGKKSNAKDVYYSLLHSIKNAYLNSTSVYEEMKSQRNIARRIGRKLYGKCIGTTLLTKGLECDTVVLLDESTTPFNYKNQYVALTRGSKQVIVIQIDNKEIKEHKEKKTLEQQGQLSLWNV